MMIASACLKRHRSPMSITLRQLDKRTIAIELTVRDQKRVLKGVGRFEKGGPLGRALHVGIHDSGGDFEIILKEDEWRGPIEPGDRFACDFAVQLDATCLCSH